MVVGDRGVHGTVFEVKIAQAIDRKNFNLHESKIAQAITRFLIFTQATANQLKCKPR